MYVYSQILRNPKMTELIIIAMIVIAIFHDKSRFSVHVCEEQHLHGDFYQFFKWFFFFNPLKTSPEYTVY